MAIERTLSIIKPDAVAKNVIGKIVSRFEAAGLKIAAAKLVQLSRAEAEQAFQATRQPSGKVVMPELVAALVALLCSPAGADITGAAIPIDGGWSAS